MFTVMVTTAGVMAWSRVAVMLGEPSALTLTGTDPLPFVIATVGRRGRRAKNGTMNNSELDDTAS